MAEARVVELDALELCSVESSASAQDTCATLGIVTGINPVEVKLPGPGRSLDAGRYSIINDGPGRWLAMAHETGRPQTDPTAIRRACRDGIAVVDLSDAWVRFRIDGPKAHRVLAALGEVSFSGEGHGRGAVRMRLAGAPAFVLQCDGGGFELLIARSYTPWFRERLDDAAKGAHED